MNEKKELLRVEHLKKYFPTPRGMLLAVDDISFCLNAGETLGVVGESGCGKSTLGRAILRLHEPTGGKVIFDGENILEYDKQKMKQKSVRYADHIPGSIFIAESKDDSQPVHCSPPFDPGRL